MPKSYTICCLAIHSFDTSAQKCFWVYGGLKFN